METLEIVPDPLLVTRISGDAQALSLLGVRQGKGAFFLVCVRKLFPYILQRIGEPPRCF